MSIVVYYLNAARNGVESRTYPAAVAALINSESRVLEIVDTPLAMAEDGRVLVDPAQVLAGFHPTAWLWWERQA